MSDSTHTSRRGSACSWGSSSCPPRPSRTIPLPGRDRRSARYLPRTGDQRSEGYVAMYQAIFLAGQGRLGEAKERLQRTRACLEAVGDPLWPAVLDIAEGHMDLALARQAEARSDG